MGSLFWLFIFVFVLPWIVKVIQKGASQNGNVIRVKDNPLSKIFQKASTSNHNTMNTSNAYIVKNARKGIFSVIGIVALLILLFNALAIIPAGETGVRALFGSVKDKELRSGLNLVNPFESITRMSVRTEEYTMSAAQGEGQRANADQITALTNEGLSVDLDITVFYRLIQDEASSVYRELGLNYPEKIIRPEIRSAIREIVAQFDAKAIYSEKRNEVATGINDLLSEKIGPRGFVVEQVLLRNVTLPSGLAESIQQKLQADQDAQRLDFVLEKETKEAERKRIEAGGQSDAQEILNRTLTPRYLQYLYISELKEREGTIYVPTGNDGLPLFRSVQ